MNDQGVLVDVYVAIGSNIDPERNIPVGLEMIAEEMRVTGISTFYRTKPLGNIEDPTFLNGMSHVQTSQGARALKFDVLRLVEERLGRIRTDDPNAPRTIDLDIALYGHAVIAEPDLQVPDPQIRERAFLSVPLLELAPSTVMPDTGEALSDVVSRTDTSGLVPCQEFSAQMKERFVG